MGSVIAVNTDDFFASALLCRDNDAHVILSAIFDQSPVGIAAIDPAGTLLLINQAAKGILNCLSDESENITWLKVCEGVRLCSLERLPLGEEEEPLALAMRENKCVTRKVLIVSPSTGRERWVVVTALPVLNSEGTMIAAVATYLDITDFKGVQDVLYRMATHDPLTGLANRALFSASLVKALTGVKRSRKGGAILALDLDNFKHVNDTMGHAAGDELLIKVADRLKGEVRETDVVARIGGDEFNILLLDMENEEDMQAAALVAERICTVLAHPFTIWGQSVLITGSIGISFFPSNGLEEEVLLSRADAALYQVKEQGKNGWKFWSGTIIADRQAASRSGENPPNELP